MLSFLELYLVLCSCNDYFSRILLSQCAMLNKYGVSTAPPVAEQVTRLVL